MLEAVYAHKTPSINPGTPKAVYLEVTDTNGQKRVKMPAKPGARSGKLRTASSPRATG